MNVLKQRLTAFALVSSIASPVFSLPVFINEIHYDNKNGDVGEAVELAGVAGQDLDGWSLVFYNGGNSQDYATWDLSGTFSDESNGFGFQSFALSSIQNGGSDGMALFNDLGEVQQFISYEGVLTVDAGAAGSLTSTDIGIAESGSTQVGHSLQLVGSGSDYEDFNWQAGVATFGELNSGQSMQALIAPSNPQSVNVPEPESLWLFALGSLLLGRRRLQSS